MRGNLARAQNMWFLTLSLVPFPLMWLLPWYYPLPFVVFND